MSSVEQITEVPEDPNEDGENDNESDKSSELRLPYSGNTSLEKSKVDS